MAGAPVAGAPVVPPPGRQGQHAAGVADGQGADPAGGIGRLKRNRAVATRHYKLAVRYEATVHIAAINEWLRHDL